MDKQKRKTKPYPSAWPDGAIAVLKKHYPTKDNDEVAALTGKSVSAVRNMAGKLRLKKSTRYWDKPWEKFVIKNYPVMNDVEIAHGLLKKFGAAKTKWAIINKYRELMGLRQKN